MTGGRLYYFFALAALALMSGVYIPGIVDLSSTEVLSQGSPIAKGLWLLIYGVLLFCAAPHRRRIYEIIRENRLLSLFVLMTLASSIWSLEPLLTLRRSSAFVLSTLFGIDLALRYSVRQQIKMMGWLAGILIGLSAFCELFLPGLIPAPSLGGEATLAGEGGWHGVFSQKNIFGHIITMASIIILLRFWNHRSRKIVNLGCLITLLLILQQTRSQTPAVVIVMTLVALLYLSTLRWKIRKLTTLGVSCILTAVPLAAGFLLNPGVVAGLVGRTKDLTGRTLVWALAFESIGKRPILGYGYSAFWGVSADSSRINDLLGWNVPHAHNFYIDITLHLGYVGIIIFLACYLFAFRDAITYLRHDHRSEALWPLACLVMSGVQGLSESDMFASNSFFWVLFVMACVSASRAAHAQAAQRQVSSSQLYGSPFQYEVNPI
jgi:exopolysaccharide production protein ExoQ